MTHNIETAALDPLLIGVKRRAALATGAVLVAGTAGGISAALLDRRLTLLPAAFVLGWLNLAGL